MYVCVIIFVEFIINSSNNTVYHLYIFKIQELFLLLYGCMYVSLLSFFRLDFNIFVILFKRNGVLLFMLRRQQAIKHGWWRVGPFHPILKFSLVGFSLLFVDLIFFMSLKFTFQSISSVLNSLSNLDLFLNFLLRYYFSGFGGDRDIKGT